MERQTNEAMIGCGILNRASKQEYAVAQFRSPKLLINNAKSLNITFQSCCPQPIAS